MFMASGLSWVDCRHRGRKHERTRATESRFILQTNKPPGPKPCFVPGLDSLLMSGLFVHDYGTAVNLNCWCSAALLDADPIAAPS